MNKRENIKRLMKIQLIQHRSLFYAFIGLLVFYTIILAIGIADVHFHPENNLIWNIYSGRGIQSMVLAVTFGLFIVSYNLLSKDEISMFPGSVLSKYYSTVLAYHFMILCFILEAILMYLILGALLMLAVHQWQELIPYSVFSWEYLWKGSLILLGRCLAVYAFGLFWYALIEQFRFRVWPILYLAVGGCIVLLIFVEPEMMLHLVQAYSGNSLSFTPYLFLLFGTWALCLLLSWILARKVRYWKRVEKTHLISAFIAVWACALVISIGIRSGYSYSDTFDLREFQELTDHQASSLVDVSMMAEGERRELEDLPLRWETPSKEDDTWIYLSSFFCSVSEAKEYGLDFDESGIDENHIMILLGSQDLKYQGQDLGEKILQSCENAIVLKQYEEEEEEGEEISEEANYELASGYYYQVSLTEKPVVVMNEGFGDFRRFLSDTTLDNGRPWTIEAEGMTSRLRRVVIYPDEWNLQIGEEE